MRAAPDWEDPRRLLSRHGLAPKRGYSQNFLVARPIVERIAQAVVERSPDGRVVELGPGLGTLTCALLRHGLQVVAVEADPDMRHVLQAELEGVPRVEVLEGDAAQLDFAALKQRVGGAFALAGNLPYAITGAIFRQVTDSPEAAEAAIFMVQREVRDRLLASPGSKTYGALSVFTQARFRVEGICRVSAGCFHPPPRVESAVVALSPLKEPRAPVTHAFERTVRAAFEGRRKTLRNALARVAEAQGVQTALQEAGIDPRRRGETLSVEEFGELATRLSPWVEERG